MPKYNTIVLLLKKRLFILPSHFITLLLKKLFILLSSGIPLIDAIRLLSAFPLPSQLQQSLLRLKIDLEQGFSLSRSLKKHPSLFDHLSCSLIEIGEQAGTLPATLNRLIQYRKKMELLNSKAKKALCYPLTVIVISAIVMIGLFVFVVPTFESIFSQYNAQLPIFTQILFSLSYLIKSYGIFVIICIILIYAILHYYYQSNTKWRYRIETWLLKIPILGQLIQKTVLAHTFYIVSVTYQSGISLSQGTEMAIRATKNLHAAKAFTQIRDALQNGQTLHNSMKKTGFVPTFILALTQVGEISGNLHTMLDSIVLLLEEEIDTTITYSMTLLEPLIMITLGIVVGSLVIAIYLPLFKLGDLF